MEKVLTDAIVVIGLLMGSGWGVKSLHDAARKELIRVLKMPSPSLANYTAKLTR